MIGEQHYKQQVEILLSRDSETFQRLEALAQKTGKPIEELFEWAVVMGMEEHLKKTVRVLERLHDES